MKYFKKEANSDRKGSVSLNNAHRKAFARNFRAYQKQLVRLQGRISRQAWNFFALGFGGWSLHDATLLSFTVGDGLDYQFKEAEHFDVNKRREKVRIQFLNRQKTMLYSFICTDIRKVVFNYPVQDRRWDWRRVDDLDTYELTAAGKYHLSLEFQFSSDAVLQIEFRQLKFLRQRVNRASA